MCSVYGVMSLGRACIVDGSEEGMRTEIMPYLPPPLQRLPVARLEQVEQAGDALGALSTRGRWEDVYIVCVSQ